MGELRKFLFEGLPVRGMLVRLDDAWREVLARRAAADGGAFASEVRALLGEMTAAAVLLQAGIEFDGTLVLQVFGDGPVRLAVVEVQSDLSFRTTAKVVGEVRPGAGLEALLNAHGQGRCAITLDPGEGAPHRQPYQGVVPLARSAGDGRLEPLRSVQEVLEHYMRQSEQLDTRFVLAADDERAAGLLIQRLPVQGGRHFEVRRALRQGDEALGAEAFERIALLAATLTRAELLALPPEQVLHRLFWQETLRLFAPDPQAAPRFACRCSRERVRAMLRSLGRAESDSLIAERGLVEVACEFCGQAYRFDAVDVGEMFTPGRDQPPASAVVQ